MRWTIRISILLFLAWAIFMVSPFVALYDLGKAVEAKDLDRITERVNFNALRVSLSQQILGEYVKTTNLDEFEQDVISRAGGAVLNPVVEQLVTPQALIDLMEDGWPQQSVSAPSSFTSPLRVDLASLEQAWQIFISSEAEGFRSITIPLPTGEAKDRQFRLTMRLRGTTWRLSGLELPMRLREELVKRAASTKR